MNLTLFKKLMKDVKRQYLPEWQMFLEVCEIHLKRHRIKNPIVVELGNWLDEKKPFYEQLFGADYIGITPSALYNPISPMLKKKLNGRLANILVIDVSHTYENTKKAFKIYSPFCSDIIVLADIESFRHKKRTSCEVWKLWDKLRLSPPGNFLFLSIFKRRDKGCQRGIGIIIKS